MSKQTKLIVIGLLVIVAISVAFNIAQCSSNKDKNDGIEASDSTATELSERDKRHGTANATERDYDGNAGTEGMHRASRKQSAGTSGIYGTESETTNERRSTSANRERNKRTETNTSNNKTAGLELSEKKISFRNKQKGIEKIVKVKCDRNDWYVSSKPQWVTVRRHQKMFTVEAQENKTGDKRTGTIIVSSGNRRASLTVVQSKRGFLPNLKVESNLKKYNGYED